MPGAVWAPCVADADRKRDPLHKNKWGLQNMYASSGAKSKSAIAVELRNAAREKLLAAEDAKVWRRITALAPAPRMCAMNGLHCAMAIYPVPVPFPVTQFIQLLSPFPMRRSRVARDPAHC